MIWNEIGWSILILILSICLYGTMIIKYTDPVIGFVAIWVYIAILNK